MRAKTCICVLTHFCVHIVSIIYHIQQYQQQQQAVYQHQYHQYPPAPSMPSMSSVNGHQYPPAPSMSSIPSKTTNVSDATARAKDAYTFHTSKTSVQKSESNVAMEALMNEIDPERDPPSPSRTGSGCGS